MADKEIKIVKICNVLRVGAVVALLAYFVLMAQVLHLPPQKHTPFVLGGLIALFVVSHWVGFYLLFIKGDKEDRF